jgi:hypothetical protein
MCERGITFEVVYTDPDLFEVVVSVANKTFSGAVSLFTSDTELADAARAIAGFPTGRNDVRDVCFGVPGRDWAGGAAILRFLCVDSVGHVLVEATVEAGEEFGGVRQRATLAVPSEPASVDNFVNELAAIASTRKGSAFLRGAG